MTIKLKVYKLLGTLNKDFSNVEEAQRTAALAAEKYPDMKFEPEVELSDVAVVDLSDFGKDEIHEVNPWFKVDRM
ncbi:MAG: hypothetical protein R6V46_16765 [Desulfatiglandaceae bacterium]